MTDDNDHIKKLRGKIAEHREEISRLNEEQWKLPAENATKRDYLSKIDQRNRAVAGLEEAIDAERARIKAARKANEVSSTRTRGLFISALGIVGIISGFGGWPMWVGLAFLLFGGLMAFGADATST